jgi:branched-chain amino acid transport system ATP-binding protein
MTLLEVTGVDAFYGDFQALFDVSLSVEEGSTVAVIGANGAGKSTLLKTVAGAVQPASGAVRYAGSDLRSVPAHIRVARGIALVPEGRRVFRSLSVEENLDVGAHCRRPGPWTKARVLSLFPLLERLSTRQASHLSGGEQQTLAIGRALMSNPALLLLDEVSLGLAPVVVKSLYSALPMILAEGTSVLLVEQDVSQALASADTVYCLLEGQVSLHGKPGELSRDGITAAYFGLTSTGSATGAKL